MIMAPVPSLIYQTMIALPIIIMYQVAIVIVWFQHRPGGRASIEMLKRQDEYNRQQRLLLAQRAKIVQPELITESASEGSESVMHNNNVDRLALVQ